MQVYEVLLLKKIIGYGQTFHQQLDVRRIFITDPFHQDQDWISVLMNMLIYLSEISYAVSIFFVLFVLLGQKPTYPKSFLNAPAQTLLFISRIK